MSKVISAHAVSVDGYISSRTPDGGEEFGCGLGDATMLFDWYVDGDTPSRVFDGSRLSAASARVFDNAAARVGPIVAGRTTYDHSSHFGGVPVLLGGGHSFFRELPKHVRLNLVEAVPAPGVTHLHHEVAR